MEPWKAPAKAYQTRIVSYGGIVAFQESPKTPGLNQYANRPVIASRLIIGKDFYGAISHPEGDKALHPNINEILSVILLPEQGGELKSEGQYIGQMVASFEGITGIWDKFQRFDENGLAVYQRNGNVGEIVYQGGEARQLTDVERKRFDEYEVPGRREQGELITVHPRFQEAEFEFREPGKEIPLEDMLKLHNQYLE